MTGWDVKTSRRNLQCPRCAADGLMAVQVPRTDGAAPGVDPSPYVTRVLCAGCDRGPIADPLIAFFAVDEWVQHDNAAAFGDLVKAWVATLAT